MRIRSSRTIVYSLADGVVVGCNYLSRSVFECSPDVISLLAALGDWTDCDDLATTLPDLDPEDALNAIEALQSLGAVVVEGSELDHDEKTYESAWQWGLPAALMHFSQQDKEFISLEAAEAMQLDKVATQGRLALYQTNPAQSLPLRDPMSGPDVISLMAKRRSVRMARPERVTIDQISDCLFAGLGITGETENCAGRLPLKMTPSGGARNPYEAYVFVRQADGLEPGIYHYSALEHSLAFVAELGDISFAAMIGGQEWGDEMGVMIILMAHLERTMWKYADDNAYRVVLIEAGHIGQNVMLAATAHGLTSCPTAALNHSLIRAALSDRVLTHSPIYALSLSVPDHARAAANRRRMAQ